MSNAHDVSPPAAATAGEVPADTQPAFVMPKGFKISEVPPNPLATPTGAPPLGPLAAFTGTFEGSGFNTIFRPQNAGSPTHLPVPVKPLSDNVLELNITSETLSFSSSLGSVPNRGTVQPDIFLNGVPYLQTITDITNPHQPIAIHFEPGIWLIVPITSQPKEDVTLTRQASIPHGATIEAQGSFATHDGPPTIKSVDITPFVSGTNPPRLVPFPSQTASNNPPAKPTSRIPQDLTSFIAAGTITQEILTDPNTVLRNHLKGLTITSTTTLFISTSPALPRFGGGISDIAFLLGDSKAAKPNAQALLMTATFWIETVEFPLVVPQFTPGQAPLLLKPTVRASGPLPTFSVTPPSAITAPRTIVVTATQIQYSQQVFLNFNGLTWPHVSVATLVPKGPIVVPPSVFP